MSPKHINTVVLRTILGVARFWRKQSRWKIFQDIIRIVSFYGQFSCSWKGSQLWDRRKWPSSSWPLFPDRADSSLWARRDKEQISVQKESNHMSGTSTPPHIYLLKSNLNTPHSSPTHLVIQLFRPRTAEEMMQIAQLLIMVNFTYSIFREVTGFFLDLHLLSRWWMAACWAGHYEDQK